MIKRNILAEYVNDFPFPEKKFSFTVMFACSVCVYFGLATKPIYSFTQSLVILEKRTQGKETNSIDSKSDDSDAILFTFHLIVIRL